MNLTIEGKAYINGSFEKCCIGISEGKIINIKKILKGDEHLDFGNKLILPAGIDIHVHFRDPGLTHKEDFITGSKSAAFGGISCVFDMPNTLPQTTSLEALSNKIKSLSKKSYVDFGIYAGIVDNNINIVDSLAEKCNGFKIYLGNTTNALRFDVNNFKKTLVKIGSTNKPILFHAEDDQCLKKYQRIEKDLNDHLRSHPVNCEEKALKNIFLYFTGYKGKFHICHVSSCEALELLKKRTGNISCGVTPHHLLFSIEQKPKPQSWYKVNPPIRSNYDQEGLFEGFKNGYVDIIESDHAPHTLDEKEMDFNDAPAGIPGVETMFPLLLAMAKKRELSFQRLISALCEKPADLLDVPKGRIKEGLDADLVVIDIKKVSKIKAEKLHSKCEWSPFEGWSAVFPNCLFLRGEKLIEDDDLLVNRGFGNFVGE